MTLEAQTCVIATARLMKNAQSRTVVNNRIYLASPLEGRGEGGGGLRTTFPRLHMDSDIFLAKVKLSRWRHPITELDSTHPPAHP